jgi:hypothetical protein
LAFLGVSRISNLYLIADFTISLVGSGVMMIDKVFAAVLWA